MSHPQYCPDCGKPLGAHDASCPSCGLTLVQTDLTKASGGDDVTLAAAARGQEELALEAGRVLGGRYEILGVIGKGGMGWVYKARDREIDRLVALKVIRQDLVRDETALRRFRDEIILARRVTHKNVLRIFDIAEVEGIKLISMPYVEGSDLKALIVRKGRLGIDEAVALARQVAEALRCAHEAGVIHRDLKPQNVLIDGEGAALVTDFGIAKSVEHGGLTVTGQIIGTPEYMSPEQAEGLDVDHRTDIYSFGLVLYEMLTGQVPFKADSIISTLMKRLREVPAAPSAANPSVPAWLDRLVGKALERQAADRYASFAEIVADIDSQTVKVKRRLRPRTLAILAAVVAAGILAALIGVFRPSLVVRQARTYLAILPFENTTRDGNLDWLSSGIPDNLTADLAQSKYFRIMSPERLREVVAELGKSVGDLVSPGVIDDVAGATGLDAFVVGNVVKAGETIRITIRVVNAQNREGIGTRSVEGSESDLLEMIDRLASGTKQIFRLSQEQIDAELDRELAAQRTKSVKAAADFAKGLDHSYSGALLDAAQAFEAAISADQDFAMAYAKAAEAYQKLGYDEKAEQLSFAAVDKLVKFTDRIPPADRTFIMAQHAGITHNTVQAIQSYKDFIADYPDDPEGYYNLGVVYASVSSWLLAQENFSHAISLDPKWVSARFELGKVLINRNRLDDALVELEDARDAYKEMGNGAGEAGVLNAIGVAYKRKNELARAAGYYGASIEISQRLGDKRATAASLGNLGLVYEIMGERDKALDAFQRSLELRKQIGDNAGISNALSKIGQIYQSDGRFEEALSNFERSYEIRKGAGSKDHMASALSDMANVYSLMGLYDKSLTLDSAALALRTEIGDAGDQAYALMNIAETLLSRGQVREARATLGRAAALTAEVGDERLTARERQAAGGLYLQEGRADSAVVCLSAALAVQRSVGDRVGCAATTSLLGDALTLRGEYTQALAHFDTALVIAGEIRDRDLVANACVGKASVWYQLGYLPGLDSALAVLAPYEDAALSHQMRCHLAGMKARQLEANGRAGEVIRACDGVVAASGSEDVRCREAARLTCGRARLELGEAREAWEALNQVAANSRKLGLGDLEAEALRLLARSCVQLGRPADAVGFSGRALELAGSLGIGRIDYLLTCGDANRAAGDAEKAASCYKDGLDLVGALIDGRFPKRARQAYLSSKDAAACVQALDGVLTGLGRGAEAAPYRARFELK